MLGLISANSQLRLAWHSWGRQSECPSAKHVAEGLVAGNPSILEVQERGSAPVEEVINAVAKAVSKKFGDNPLRTPLQAIVFSTFR